MAIKFREASTISEKLNILRKVSNTQKPSGTMPYYMLRHAKHPPTGPCEVCGGYANCQHHIIPLCNNGEDTVGNRINICNNCHSLIHPWMKSNKPIRIK
jgi:hypothetical protein